MVRLSIPVLLLLAVGGCTCGPSIPETPPEPSSSAFIVVPKDGSYARGTPVVVAGTALATGATLVAVEVSVDNGVTWKRAQLHDQASITTPSGTVQAPSNGKPWTFELQAPDGPVVVRARPVIADDARGDESPQVRFTVDNTAPTVQLLLPVAGATLRGTGAQVSGTAQDSNGVATVEVSTDDGATWAQASGTGSWTWNWTMGADGARTLKARAVDKAGNVAVSAGAAVLVDNTPPVTTLTAPTPGQALRGVAFTITGSAVDPKAQDGTSSGLFGVELSTDDGATWAAAGLNPDGSFSATWTLPADGATTVRARARDRANNLEAAGPAHAVTVDNTKPTAQVTAPPANAWMNGASLTFQGTASDNQSGVARVEVSVNGAAYTLATGTQSWSLAFTPSAQGPYDVRARATDAAGNVGDPSANHIVLWDNTPPSCAVVDPQNGQTLAGTTFTISGTASDGASGVATVQVSTDNGATWAAATGTATWTLSFTAPGAGTYQLRCRAADRAGNVGAPSNASAVTIDPALPSSRITNPTSGQAFSAASYAVTGTASSTSAPVTRVEVSTNNGTSWTQAVGTTSWSYAWTGIAEGSYTLRSRATNGAGATEVSSPTVSVTVDRTRPSSSITSPTPNLAFGGTSRAISGVSADALSGVTAVQVSTDDGATWNNVGSGLASWTWTWTPLPSDGTYRLRSRATDRAGNVELPAPAVVVRVDNTPPSSAITTPANGAALRGTSYTLTGTATDATAGVLRVEVSLDGGATWQLATGTTGWSYLWPLPTDGTYTLQSRATDLAGNVETPTTAVTVTVDNGPPSSAITDPVANQAVAGAVYTVRGTAQDGTGSGVTLVEVSADNGATWSAAAGTTSWTYAWTTPTDGSVTLRSRARDAAGNVETPGGGVTVLVDKTGPVATLTSPTAGAKLTGASTVISGTAQDGAGSGVASVDVSTNGGATWTAATLGAGGSWTYGWNLPADGTYELRARGTDAAGNPGAPTTAVSVQVDNTAPSSAITSPSAGATLRAATVTVSGTWSDGAGSGVTLVEVSTDDGATWNAATLGAPGTWSYAWTTPTDGTYTLRSRATDGVNLVETPGAGVTVTVDKTAPSSAIVSPSDGSSVSAATQAVAGTAQDGSGSGVALVEVSTNGGTSWASATGTTSWTWTWNLPAAAGAYGVVSRATDAAGNVETPGTGFTYHVPPVLSSVTPLAAAEGTAVTLVGDRFGATQGPSAVSFNGTAATAVLAWSNTQVRVVVPAGATTGNVVVTVNAEASAGVTFTVLGQPTSGVTTVVAGGQYSSVAIGRDGMPVIAHIDPAGTPRVQYTTYSGSAWTTTTLETATALAFTSLALDANGVAHVSYQRGTGNQAALRHATCSSGCNDVANWTFTTIESGTVNGRNGPTGGFTSIALTSTGLPLIAFYDDASGRCTPSGNSCARLAVYSGTAWATEIIDTTTSNNVGPHISLAIDSQDRPHVAYYDEGNRNLMYAAKVGTWGITSVDQTGTVGRSTSLALSSDLPRIAQIDDTNDYLAVHTFNGFAWTKHNQLDNLVNFVVGARTSLVMGTDGRERVAYFRSGSSQLRAVSYNGTGWNAPATLATGGGLYCSARLDGLNRLRVAFQTGASLTYYADP